VTQFGDVERHEECSLPIMLFIVVDCRFFGLSSMEGSYGYALDVMESCCFEGRLFTCDDEKDVWLQQNPGVRIVSASSLKISKDEH
jgi:hypothetical protein